MGLFALKKSKKDLAKENEQKTIEAQPKKTQTRFVPRHGASRTSTQGSASSLSHEMVSSPSSPTSQGDYFNNIPEVPSFKNRSSGSSDPFSKDQITSRYGLPYTNSTDSGYESADPLSGMHSRVHSEHNLYDDAKAYVTLDDTLPELRLDAASSVSGTETSASGKGVDSVSPLDLNSDTQSIQSCKSVSKRTRFEDQMRPEELEQRRKDSDRSSSSSPSLGPQQDLEPTFVQLERPQAPAIRLDTSTASQFQAVPRQSIPPLDILDGFKVNKQGRVLNEEGDPIGELVDGDLLDCVRQKANASGEVVDECGRVVGHVRTYASTSDELASLPQSLTYESLSAQDPKRMPRSASERSLSELSKTYARPTMSSVPEDNVPEDDAAPASPGLFSYRGDIPVVDGPVQSKRRSRSPPYAAQPMFPAQIQPGQAPGPAHYAKLALVGGHSTSSLVAPMRPGMANPRRATTPVQHRLPPALKKTSSYGYGYDHSPNGSDSGSDPSFDDGRMLTMGHSRAGSVRTMATVSKPRTYFTHAGRITVDSDTPLPAAAKPKPTPAAASATATAEKKKSRMKMSFGKKSKVAA